jgi:hypothetical protein
LAQQAHEYAGGLASALGLLLIWLFIVFWEMCVAAFIAAGWSHHGAAINAATILQLLIDEKIYNRLNKQIITPKAVPTIKPVYSPAAIQRPPSTTSNTPINIYFFSKLGKGVFKDCIYKYYK